MKRPKLSIIGNILIVLLRFIGLTIGLMLLLLYAPVYYLVVHWVRKSKEKAKGKS